MLGNKILISELSRESTFWKRFFSEFGNGVRFCPVGDLLDDPLQPGELEHPSRSRRHRSRVTGHLLSQRVRRKTWTRSLGSSDVRRRHAGSSFCRRNTEKVELPGLRRQVHRQSTVAPGRQWVHRDPLRQRLGGYEIPERGSCSLAHRLLASRRGGGESDPGQTILLPGVCDRGSHPESLRPRRAGFWSAPTLRTTSANIVAASRSMTPS